MAPWPPKTLRECALVNSSFWAVAQKCIFSTVELVHYDQYSPHPPHNQIKFLDALNSAPHLALHVHTLQIRYVQTSHVLTAVFHNINELSDFVYPSPSHESAQHQPHRWSIPQVGDVMSQHQICPYLFLSLFFNNPPPARQHLWNTTIHNFGRMQVDWRLITSWCRVGWDLGTFLGKSLWTFTPEKTLS